MKLDWHGLFDYYEETVKKVVSDTGGNYMISVGLKKGGYRPVYVGRTKHLETRLLKHLSNDEENKCIKNRVSDKALYFRYCYVNNQEDRKNIEYTLYNKYTPECNEIIPDGNEITITFPY